MSTANLETGKSTTTPLPLRTSPSQKTRKRIKNIGIFSACTLIALPVLSFGISQLYPATTTREITINASPKQVWEVLADLERFPSWHPTITSFSGTAEVSKTLAFTNEENGSAMSFNPTVLVATPNKELRWLGHVAFPGLMDGNHSFTLEAIGDNRTKVVQEESFTGILGLFAPLMMDLGPSFEASNHALLAEVTKATAN